MFVEIPKVGDSNRILHIVSSLLNTGEVNILEFPTLQNPFWKFSICGISLDFQVVLNCITCPNS